jgi:molybdopterin-containing oxidoreductase family iron-sulfur binding subunit
MPDLDRREFLKVVGLSAGAAAAAGCQDPVERVIPYLIQPEEIVPGNPTYYASTCRECPMACAIHVKTREGRPIKVEGSPDDPIAHGAMCGRGQAGLARTYDASRFRGPMRRQAEGLVPIPWEEALNLLVEKLRPAAGAGRVAFLGGLETGTQDKVIDGFLEAIGSPHRVQFELYAHESLRAANQTLFGTGEIPQFDLGQADVVVSFGTDFLETWLNPVQNQSGFSGARRGGKGYAAYVGPRLSLSGANADLWVSAQPGTEVLVALALAHDVSRKKRNGLPSSLRRLLEPYSPSKVSAQTGVPAHTIESLASRIAQAQTPLALPPGNELAGTNATDLAIAVQLLNVASGALGKTVRFGADHAAPGRFSDLKDLAGRMRGGEVEVLLVHDTNPVYSVPRAFGFADAMAKVPFKVSFSSANDETTALADLVLPDHTPYEAWGDAEPVRGVRRLQQPTVRPLFDTRALPDVLLDLGRRLGAGDRLPAGSFRDVLAARWGDVGFDDALAKGGDFKPAAGRRVGLRANIGNLQFTVADTATQGDLTLLAYPSIQFYDGRSARIARLQETPDPVTKTAWGSFAEIHTETATRLGLKRGDVVKLATEVGEIELPVFPHAAIREDVVAVAAGQGHQPVDPAAPEPDLAQRRSSVGVNVLAVLPGRIDARSGGLAWLSTRVRLQKIDKVAIVPVVQRAFDQENRGLAQSTTLAALEGHEEEHADAPHLETKPFHPAEDAAATSPYRWGMTIDLDACTGCQACVSACSQENNIPIVGPNLVAQGREMSWIRLERYVEEHDGELDVRHSPMLCQHCGAAPCENVCPTLATVHGDEGLNVMAYNRCIGTRYCSNNCPYKVRRFNYFPYDFWVREPEHLGLNPDVTVRTKGVMEKCTFCVQRIHVARDQAKLEDREIREGEVTPACAQTCPSKAITFGNLRDPESQVALDLDDRRAYHALDSLYTRPAVGYLRSIRRSDGHKA